MIANDTARGARLADAWRANWPYLVGLAFGMLGDIGAAEDAVQEAFARLARTEPDQIDDERGWLIVVTSRICLDQIRSARFQRDRPHDATAIESAGVSTTPALPVDPADRVTLDDQVRLALLVVLDRLAPAERVAFILHDVFQMPFTAIAETLGKSAATSRQLAKRARAKIQSWSLRPAVPAGTSQHRQVTEQFIKACSGGDLDALVGLLDPDIWGAVDLGPFDTRTGQGSRGPLQVARNLLRYFGTTTTLVSNPVAGPAVILAFAGQRLTGVILLTIDGERIRKIHVIADPAKVGFLSSQLPAALRVQEAAQQFLDRHPAVCHGRSRVVSAGDHQGDLIKRGQDHVRERADQFGCEAPFVGDRLHDCPDGTQRMLLVHRPPALPAKHGRRVNEDDPLDDRVASEANPRHRGRVQGGDRVGGILGRLGQLGEDAVLRRLDHRLEQGIFPREVMIERAAADAGCREYRLDRGVLISLFGEQPGGDLDELAARGPSLRGALGHRPRRRAARGWLQVGHGTHLYPLPCRGATLAGHDGVLVPHLVS
jgi:RNA polymerase sigma-70 factor (ECF subfamily)